KFAFARPCVSASAAETARFLVNDLIYPMCATPTRILSDRAPSFLGDLIKELAEQLKLGHSKTSGYYPQTNGLCAHYNGTLIDMLSHYTDQSTSTCAPLARAVTFAYNTSVQDTTGFTPCEMLFGRRAVLPTEVNLTFNDDTVLMTNKQLTLIDR